MTKIKLDKWYHSCFDIIDNLQECPRCKSKITKDNWKEDGTENFVFPKKYKLICKNCNSRYIMAWKWRIKLIKE